MITNRQHLQAWFAGQVPEGWFSGPVEVGGDRDEILVTGTLAEPSLPEGATDDDRVVAQSSRIARFREDTREQRIAIATQAEAATETKVSWAVTCGSRREVFTNLSAPVMTRLRLAERQVLDTLVNAGAARSRSDAMAWCVRLVGQHQGDWIEQLRVAMVEVDRVRETGPTA